MVRIVLPSGANWVESRLRRAGHAVGVAEGPPPPLDEATAGEVWWVPEDVLAGAAWARLRVELGRSPRFFVVVLRRSATRGVVSAVRDGAFDVVAEDDDDGRWEEAVREAEASQRLWLRLYAGPLSREAGGLVGVSSSMNTIRRDLERLGPTDVTVLLEGESGAGKERVAAALHAAGRGGPMVTLNCAAMPRELVEAELFGAEKGAFTGAVRSRPGLVEQAAGGTLLLDEVGELDLALQPKLLRFLETRRARRVGGASEYTVLLRVVAATNRDLQEAVRAGAFRADLYYRLAEVVIRVPPLRERRDDVPDLAMTFLRAAAERFGKHFDTIEPGLLLRFQEYLWPGNVRELRSTIDRLVLFHEGPVLRSGWWEPPTGVAGGGGTRREGGAGGGGGEVPGVFPSRTARVELAQRLLAEGRLSLTEIAARAGVHPTTLFRWRRSGKAGGSAGPG